MATSSAPRSRRSYTLAVLGLTGVVAWILSATLARAAYEPNSDDGYYLSFMREVAQHGLGRFPELFASWNGGEKHWIHPSPLRLGFIAFSALWAKVFGASLVSLSWISIVSHLGWILMNGFFARRWLGEARGFLLTLLLACSPLLLGISRQALSDSTLLLFLGACVWIFREMLEHPEQRRWRILFGLSFACAVLVKELTVLLALPLAACLAWEHFGRKSPVRARGILLALVVPPLAVLPLYLLAAGGFAPLSRTVEIVLGSPAANPYAVKYGSGPWYRYLIDYLCLSPGITLLALGFAGVLALRLRRGEHERTLVLLACVACGLLFEMSFFTKNVRYLLILELPLRAFALAFLGELAGSSRRATWIVAGAVLGLCALDGLTFHYAWVENQLYDPLSGALFIMRGILPMAGGN